MAIIFDIMKELIETAPSLGKLWNFPLVFFTNLVTFTNCKMRNLLKSETGQSDS